jgi:hypothetical protein
MFCIPYSTGSVLKQFLVNGNDTHIALLQSRVAKAYITYASQAKS